MKHVFAVTSHLTFSVMYRIAEVNNLELDDCVLLLLRDYTVPDNKTDLFKHQIATSYNVDINKGRVFAGLCFWKTKSNIRKFDERIDSVIGEEQFFWYTPVCSNDVCSLMVTKKNCVGFYVTEDGMASYRKYNPQTFTGVRYVVYRTVLKPLFPRLFEAKNHFIESDHPKFKGCISTSDKCFPLHQHCLKIVGSPFEPVALDYEIDAVISVDPLYQFVGIEKAEEVYQKLSDYIQKRHNYHQIVYKMHPRFNAASNLQHYEEYEGLIKKYFQGIIKINASIVLENLLASCKADFYSFNSSVAIYASLSGSKCYNILPLLKGTPAYEEQWIIDECTIPVEND